jgi:HEAT repeat protein
MAALTPKTLMQYCSSPLEQRVAYLHLALEERNAGPTETFFIDALRAEQHPLPKWYLIKAVGLQKDPAAIALLLAIGKSPDVDLSETSLHRIAAWSLGQIGSESFHAIARAFDDASTDIERVFLVDALGEIRQPIALPLLVRAFVEGSDQVKLWAALSLSKSGISALGTLRELLKNTQSRRDKLLLEDALTKITNQSLAKF